MTTGQRTFVELFSGGGLARAGLGPGWRCMLACDMDASKIAAYRANWGDGGDLAACDVRDLDPERVGGRADLLWASPPCQDLSTAGLRAGIDGVRSGAVWPAVAFLRRLCERGHAPRLVVMENVPGMALSARGGDLAALADTLAGMGYRVGAFVLDARLFVPQSRPRLFVVAAAADVSVPEALIASGPDRRLHPAAVEFVAAALREPTRGHWTWWLPPAPPPMRTDLVDLLEADDVVRWHASDTTASLLAMMTPVGGAPGGGAAFRSDDRHARPPDAPGRGGTQGPAGGAQAGRHRAVRDDGCGGLVAAGAGRGR